MEAQDLAWLCDTLPTLVDGRDDVAARIADAALLATANDPSRPMTRAVYFEHLAWELCHHLQALWAFGHVSLEEATDRANVLTDHLLASRSDCTAAAPQAPPQAPAEPKEEAVVGDP